MNTVTEEMAADAAKKGRKEALQMSIVKWFNVVFGCKAMQFCALCERYRDHDDDYGTERQRCTCCPLARMGECCYTDDSFFDKWADFKSDINALNMYTILQALHVKLYGVVYFIEEDEE